MISLLWFYLISSFLSREISREWLGGIRSDNYTDHGLGDESIASWMTGTTGLGYFSLESMLMIDRGSKNYYFFFSDYIELN